MRIALALLLLAVGCRGGSDETISIRVPPRSTLRTVAESLSAHSLIRSKTWFRVIGRMRHVDRVIKPGVYQFSRKASTGGILARLKNGEAVQIRITLPPGGTRFDLARAVQDKLGIPTDSFLKATTDTLLLHKLEILGPSVDGWLLPESFDFDGFSTPVEIIERFALAARKAWQPNWNDRAAAAGLDRTTLLTLASIVQGEAVHAEELPIIAAVYRNRLKIGMALQADPTIQYGYLVRDGQRKDRLYNKDYAFDSPWNTYRFRGLPPGPIGNPSREAIEAVLSPAPVKYLYFVAGPDGHHQFSVDYNNQLRNIRKRPK